MNEALKVRHSQLHAKYVSWVQDLKREWLKENPPTDLVHHLNDPIGNIEKRQKAWDSYIISQATVWWKECGWKITFGAPNEGCYFEPIS